MSSETTEAVVKKKKSGFRFSWSWISIPSLVLFWFVAVLVMDYNRTGSLQFGDDKSRVIPQFWEVVQEFNVMVTWDDAKATDPYLGLRHRGKHEKTVWTLGALGPHIWQSFKEVVLGFALAVFIALLLGFWAGFSRGFREYITPLNGVFMSIPAIAWAPMMLLYFEEPFVAIVMVVYIAAVSPMIIAIMEGVLTITGTEVRAARSLGANAKQLFIYVYLPASLPFITAGMRIGFAQAWRALVAAEMVGGIGIGLGHLVNMSEQLGSSRTMFVGIVFIGLLSYVFERLIFRRIERHYEVWRIH